MQRGTQTPCRHTHACTDNYLSKLFVSTFNLYNVDFNCLFLRDERHSATEKYLVPHDFIYFSDKHLLGLSLFQMFDATAWQLFCQVQQACTSRNTKNIYTRIVTNTTAPFSSTLYLSHTHSVYTHAHKVFTSKKSKALIIL